MHSAYLRYYVIVSSLTGWTGDVICLQKGGSQKHISLIIDVSLSLILLSPWNATNTSILCSLCCSHFQLAIPALCGKETYFSISFVAQFLAIPVGRLYWDISFILSSWFTVPLLTCVLVLISNMAASAMNDGWRIGIGLHQHLGTMTMAILIIIQNLDWSNKASQGWRSASYTPNLVQISRSAPKIGACLFPENVRRRHLSFRKWRISTFGNVKNGHFN